MTTHYSWLPKSTSPVVVWTHLYQVRYVCDLTMQNGLHSFSLVAGTQKRHLGTPVRSCHIIMFKQIVVSCRVVSCLVKSWHTGIGAGYRAQAHFRDS